MVSGRPSTMFAAWMRLTRRALHEVVDRAASASDGAGAVVVADGDVARVRARASPSWPAASRLTATNGSSGVVLARRRRADGAGRGPSVAGRGVARGEDPAGHRHEVRREQHLHSAPYTWRERVLDLGRVAVGQQPVGGDVLVRLARRGCGAERPRPAPETPEAASTTMPVGSTKPSASSGASASADGRRVAAGRGDVRLAA